MLDAFLEVACGKTKQAEAEAKNVALLKQLPEPVLKKLAFGNMVISKEAYGHDSDWLEKFRGTPLLDQAIAIEKEELEIEMQENERRQHERAMRQQFGDWDDTQAKRDELCIRRKLLDLELVGGSAPTPEMGGQEGEDVELPMEAAAPAPEPKPEKPPTEKVTKETTEKPAPEKVDIKTAAARIRFRMAVKEAGVEPTSAPGRMAAGAARVGEAARKVTNIAKAHPVAAGVAGGAALGAGAYAVGKKIFGDKKKEAQPAIRAGAFRK